MNAKATPFLALGLVTFVVPQQQPRADEVYFNDFNGPLGAKYPEWSASPVTFASNADPPGKGTVAPQIVTNVESPNHAQRFLGEFGGAPVGAPGQPGYNHTRVDQTITLTLHNLPPHSAVEVSFDLYILKSWDGVSPAYGPDRWSLGVANGPRLFTAAFSNNPKVDSDGSYQDYPKPKSLPRSGATATNTLGYSAFFADSTYRLSFTFAHTGDTLKLDFSSSLFEGKGTADESWGLDNVRVTTVTAIPSTAL